MKYSRFRFTVSCAALILAACATPPTQDELAALDYGSCPSNHETVIKDQFKGGLLTRYADDLLIWPPQKFWFKSTPVEGGNLYAGYLVPVMAEQTFGPAPTDGKQLYGFIFHDGVLVKKIAPWQLQTLGIKEAVGPFPKDDRDWQQGHSDGEGNRFLLEYVLPGETVQDWSELVSVQVLSNASLDLSAAGFVESIAAAHQAAAPRCADVRHEILESGPTEVLFRQALSKCAPLRDEYSVRKVIRGPRSLTEVSYARTSDFDAVELTKWTEIVSRARIMNECG